MKVKFKEKTFLVTGATGGAGPAIIERLLERGAKVLAVYRTKGKLERAKERRESISEAIFYHADLTEELTVKQLSEDIKTEQGNIDGIANLVGGFSMGRLEQTEKKDLKQAFDTHATTVFLTLKYFAKQLQKQEGSVVNFTSQRALDASTGALSYNVGKMAVKSLTESINAELDEVRVNAVAPSIINTPANRKAMSNADFQQWTSLQRVADIVEFLISDRSSTISGEIIRI